MKGLVMIPKNRGFTHIKSKSQNRLMNSAVESITLDFTKGFLQSLAATNNWYFTTEAKISVNRVTHFKRSKIVKVLITFRFAFQ